MELIKVMNKILNSKTCDWFNDLDGTEPSVVINIWLGMIPKHLHITSILDKYAFKLSSKKFIKLAWSVIPKGNRIPKFIKKQPIELEFPEIWSRVREVLQLGDNDFKHSYPYILAEIKKDKEVWFRRLGLKKKYWKQYGADFTKIKEGKKKEVKTGLQLFGI